jgi:hypothetical protein
MKPKLDPRIVEMRDRHTREMLALYSELVREAISGTGEQVVTSESESGASKADLVRSFLSANPGSYLHQVVAGTGLNHGQANAVLQRLKIAGHVQVSGVRKHYRYALALKVAA